MVSGGEGSPPRRFHALSCEGIDIDHSYSVYLFTIPIEAPVSILVRVGQRRGSLGGPNPPFGFHALICEGLDIDHSYLVYLLTIPKETPVSILVRECQRGVSGGTQPPFSVSRANMRRD